MGNSFGKSDSSDYTVELRHFNLLRCIGKGAFGKVRIVEHKEKKKLYALKYINKAQCIKMKAIQNIMRERAILEEIEHPFIVNLRFAFQDDENMFMVIDLMIGGDLRFHLERLGGFSEETLRFFCAEIACALNYLHNRGIIHRDLKPDNILLDDNSHAHITDFNIAVHIDPNRLPRSQSGTISYMAPEVFAGKGYSYPIDWWSLGIVLYEGFYGKRPFKGHNNEQVSANIVNQKEIHFPSTNALTKHPVKPSLEFLNIMKGFLIKEPEQRLGCTEEKGLDELWDNSWFRGIVWDKLERKEYKSPLKLNPDKTNFDATYDLEELLLEDNPLTYRPRKKKNKNKDNSEDEGHSKGFFGGSKSNSNASTPKTRLQAEMDYIEENFKTFDCTLFDRFSQLLENDKFLENPELMKILDEEFKNLSKYDMTIKRQKNNTHGPSGAVTEMNIKEKKMRLKAYQARLQMRQQENQPLQPPGQTYNPNRNILQHNMMAGTSNFYPNSNTSSLYGSYSDGGSNRSSPSATYDNHSHKNMHYIMSPQYNSSTPPPSQPVQSMSQGLPPTPDFYNNSNNSNTRLDMSPGNVSNRNGPTTSSLNRRSNKNMMYGSNSNTPSGLTTPQDSPKIGSSYTQQLTSNSDRERERIRQNQQLKQKLTSSPQAYHQKLASGNKKHSQNHLNHSANSDSFNSLQMSNLKDDYLNDKIGDYNLNRSINNMNYSSHSNDDIIKNILSKDELEELKNDDFLFEQRKNIFNKPMFHSSSMDELNTNKIMGQNMGKLPYNNSKLQNKNMISSLSNEENKILPLITDDELQNIGNIFDNISLSDSNLNHKKLRHGKSYDNLTSKKYNRPVEPPPPLPNGSSFTMKYDFPIPPSTPSNRPYITPSKNKGSAGYLDDFNLY